MTTKSPANVAHDAARAEDARRAHAELHGYITSLERRLAEVTRERDAYKRAKSENDERFMIERDEARRERDLAQAAERTFALRLRLVHETLGDPECEVVLTSDLVARRIHEAEEQGARWALNVAREEVKWTGAEQAIPKLDAARICAEARAKGGDHG